jgi:hypothetical protein
VLQEIIIAKLLNSFEILEAVLFAVYLILVPDDLAYRQRFRTSIFGSFILILLSLFVFLPVPVADIEDFLHRLRYLEVG